jgi:hypothetical protein
MKLANCIVMFFVLMGMAVAMPSCTKTKVKNSTIESPPARTDVIVTPPANTTTTTTHERTTVTQPR